MHRIVQPIKAVQKSVPEMTKESLWLCLGVQVWHSTVRLEHTDTESMAMGSKSVLLRTFTPWIILK